MMSLLGTCIAAWMMPFVGIILDPEDEFPSPVAAQIAEESELPATLRGFVCRTVSKCPETFLMTLQGNYEGCEDTGSGCEGSCYTCGGWEVPVSLCYPKALHTCHVGLGPLISCGPKRRYTDGCTFIKPPGGYPNSPNGCYCDRSFGYIIINQACMISQCIDG
ncbi:MAG: hypothetical protein HRU70_05525 [Phycisphaeraceae bacterium]|nr:MAG: hypothetical protein HRU70_05525 [Phycisphaeraceae bacterium]